MANISVTYTFANNTIADATQVNQNFSDIINGTSDGTKSFNIAAITCGSAATFNSNINLGATSSNAIIFNGSLTSSVPISANSAWDIGSATLGLKSVYIGGGATAFTCRILGATQSASYTLTLPPGVPSVAGFLKMDTAGTVTVAALENSQIRLNTAGVGSAKLGTSSTAILRFVNTVTNTGSDITYADSATLGGTFTIAVAGIFAISLTVATPINKILSMGISLNSSQLTTAADAINTSDRLAGAYHGANASEINMANVSWVGRLALNDVIRAHLNPTLANLSDSEGRLTFTITKLSE